MLSGLPSFLCPNTSRANILTITFWFSGMLMYSSKVYGSVGLGSSGPGSSGSRRSGRAGPGRA